MKVCHLTSVHERYDIRIFLKQCRSLAAAGHEVNLVVADGRGDEVKDGVSILDSGQRPANRFARMLGAAWQVYNRARQTHSDLYHIHDPELLPAGLLLKRSGAKVIFDSHEDYVKDIKTKPYLKYGSGEIVSRVFGVAEKLFTSKFDLVISATSSIKASYIRYGIQTEVLNNYPLREEISNHINFEERRNEICYTGAITQIRGVPTLVDAMSHCKSDARLVLIGPFTDKRAEELCHASAGWSRTIALGKLARSAMLAQMANCIAGAVTFLPVPNHIEAQPNKLFEYMACGLPVIGADFPLWKEIIETENCGICVDPTNPAMIAQAIDALLENPDKAAEMGKNGHRAVLAKFNWDTESEKLIKIYARLEEGL